MPETQTSSNPSILPDDDIASVDVAEARTFEQPTATAVSQDGSELLVDESDAETAANLSAKPAAGDIKSRLQDLKEPARQKAQAIFDDLKTRTEPKRTQAEAFVREKPYTAVGIAVLGGMILSKLLRR